MKLRSAIFGKRGENTCFFSGISCQSLFDPVEELTHFDINAGVVGLSTASAPGHETVHFSNTHQGAPRVTLTNTDRVSVSHSRQQVQQMKVECRQTHIACVSAAVHVPGTHHPARDHAWIGLLAVTVLHDGHVQTLQAGGHVHCNRQTQSIN